MPDPTKATISATQSPALWNVSPYTTRWMLWQYFANDMPLDSLDPNARMSWGLKMQPLIIEQAAAELHLEVVPNLDDTYHRRAFSAQRATRRSSVPTRSAARWRQNAVSIMRAWMRDWGGGAFVPRNYEIQLQQQMFVGDDAGQFEWGIIVAWIGAELFYFERKPIEELWLKLQSEAAGFFASV